MSDPKNDTKPREIIAIDGVFNDSDMLKNNLNLQCHDAGPLYLPMRPLHV